MSAFVRYLPAAAELLPWSLNLATWLVARSLNMPEPLVHATGLFRVRTGADLREQIPRGLVSEAPHAPLPRIAPIPTQGELI